MRIQAIVGQVVPWYASSMKNLGAGVVVILGAMAISACGSGTSPTSGDSGVLPDGAASDSSTPPDGGSCSPVSAQGFTDVIEQKLAEDVPSGDLPAPPEGTYFLKSITTYTGVGGATGPGVTRRAAIIVDAAGARWSLNLKEGAGEWIESTLTIASLSSGGYGLTPICPAQLPTKTVRFLPFVGKGFSVTRADPNTVETYTTIGSK